ncbi:MAG: 50S ribosomal protein L17 [Kiritimatiellae bacterium]|nr:50S ribosomal protein L17 [Kiritimatiellia bacterium]
MRHQRVMKKFGRSMEHRKAMMKNMVTNLILAESITTTLPKAKQARKDAEKMVTLARKGTLAARRLAASRLLQPKAVQKLFDKIVPAMDGRKGGYTRILKVGNRKGDGAEMAILQWVTAPEAKDAAAPVAEEAAPAAEAK